MIRRPPISTLTHSCPTRRSSDLPVHGVAGADHVLIGRSEGIERDFGLLRGELEKALKKVMSRPLGEAPPRRRDSSKEKKKASTGSARTDVGGRSEEHTSELQSLMRHSYTVFCLKKKKKQQ